MNVCKKKLANINNIYSSILVNRLYYVSFIFILSNCEFVIV